jgi:hypothetical protein
VLFLCGEFQITVIDDVVSIKKTFFVRCS